MWNRAGLKANAKENLRRYYWPAFLVCIISGIFSGGGRGFSFNYNDINRYKNRFDRGSSFDGFSIDPGVFFMVAGIAASVFLIIMIIALVVGILVGAPLIVGKNRYFMSNRDVNTGVGAIGYAFNSGYYWNVVKIMFLMSIYILLWTLLLIIPGIIKTYEYAMVPYILAENPEIDSARAFELSKEMMMGQKWDYFVLGLSFIGWYFVGLILCGVGMLFVNPYYEATLAEFYGWARERILASGFSNSYELKGFGEGAEF
jgi:uncharacterized membrane protein